MAGAVPRRLLVVEDDDDIRGTVCEVLSEAGYDATGVRDGAEALRQLRSGELLPTLILLDLMMPGMNGWQFVEAQRADPVLAAIPVVVVTAHAGDERKAESLGAAAYLRKPTELGDLLAIVKRFVP